MVIGVIVMWAMLAALVICAALWPLARHADRRGRPGLLRSAVSNLRRLTLSTLLALSAVFTISVAHSGKNTNGVQNVGGPHLMQTNPMTEQTVTAEEIAQGWRLESVVTNDVVSYAMPTNGVEYKPWNLRGGYETHFPLDLGDFAFPFGTSVVRRLDVLSGGTVESLPRQRGDGAYYSLMSICAAREWASIVPGVGRFWWADAAAVAGRPPYRTKLLTWENVYAGRDRTGQYNAQIEFHDDGNFITRSNNVERTYRRINPDDWDGDGLANEIDPNPCAVDGDFFGVANAMPEGANQDAYYWLDICATGSLDCATVRVTCDGQSALGDHVVIAKTNQMCHVPLLAGATYAVQSTLPISHSAVSSGYASITTNSAKSQTVSLPLEFSFVQARAESTFSLNTSPIDVGATLVSVTGGCCSCSTNEFGFAWICSGSCSCRGANEHTLSSEVLWEGYSLLFYSQKYCPCYYEEQRALSEITDRGVTLAILDAVGNPVEWEFPVLVGEAVNIDVTVGGEVMSLQDFITLFNGRLRLRAWTIGFDGEHDVIDEPVPVSAETATASGGNMFRVSVSAAWMSGGGLASNTDDGRLAKVSIDMADAATGASNRQDSDIFDANTAGRLHGRARGKANGNASAAIPEGAFNLKTIKAAGTASLEARVGSSRSDTVQVQRQADILYYSGHGSHDTGVLNGVAGPSEVSNHWHDVDTVVFAGCSVLDIEDKAGHYSGTTAGHSASPGRKWISASGAGILLGYAYKAPRDEQGAVDIIGDWCAMRSSTGDAEAWMKANDNPAGRNACAIRVLGGGRIEYRYFRRVGRGWNLRSKYSEIVEEITL